MSRFTLKQPVIASSLLLAFGQVQASGFLLPEVSIAGLGTSNALVANPKIYGAVAYNPSLAAFHKGLNVSSGLMIVHAESSVTTAAPNSGTTDDFQGLDNVFIPMLQASYQWNDQVTLGLGTSVPFGLSTKFAPSTFNSLGTSAPTETKVEIIDIAPTVAFKVTPNTSIAFGADFYWLREVAFDTAAVTNEGDGTAWGWNASVSHIAGPLSFGASFHSSADIDIQGTTAIPAFTLSSPATTSLTAPWRLQIGTRYEFNNDLALELDFSRTGWSSFKTLSISNSVGFGVPNPIVSNNNWKDANAYRLGGTYQVDDGLELRFGYTYDQTGQNDNFFSARIADADRHLFSVGFEKRLDHGLSIEGGYMLVKFADNAYRSTTVPTTDANGTLAYNGNYSTTVHLLGLGIRKQFD